ncbi:MAG: Uma2 family endonuclease [Okeania sp. SIO2C2]|uniref:Uma2 family endonuclease n=1 Tax=Okeania sp. SIO2C2 TaxID=2607787 RepID=UPI0013BD1C0B|nr:Uma2 family endonuclease [Okeania sp. SIO2C2]NEP89399.1 Uma2 family endonuclease [Okeania sp. SIO2C2]
MSTLSTQTNIESSPKSFKNQPEDFEFVEPDISDVITEDDTPVDNLITEKQQRLLTTTLYSSFQTDLPFLATVNVGLFYSEKIPQLVPDIILSLRVQVPEDWSQKQNRSYFVWYFGKPPEVAIEIVSNKIGNELGSKLQDYAFAGVGYYVVFDPLKQLGETILRVYELRGNSYVDLGNFYLSQVGLGLTIWHGIFEGKEYDWLRWCDDSENILLTGDERAEQEKQRAEQEKQRADRLAEILRERGINPDEVL